MGSGAMIYRYIPGFIEWFRHSKVDREGFVYRQHGDSISLLSFFF
jgi:hypothetical protein